MATKPTSAARLSRGQQITPEVASTLLNIDTLLVKNKRQHTRAIEAAAGARARARARERDRDREKKNQRETTSPINRE